MSGKGRTLNGRLDPWLGTKTHPLASALVNGTDLVTKGSHGAPSKPDAGLSEAEISGGASE